MHPLLRALPRPLFEALVRTKKRVEGIPGVGGVDFGDLGRVTPFSRDFGYGRGQPVDRIYIERFLEQNSADIRGSVIEIGEDTYTRRTSRCGSGYAISTMNTGTTFSSGSRAGQTGRQRLRPVRGQ